MANKLNRFYAVHNKKIANLFSVFLILFLTFELVINFKTTAIGYKKILSLKSIAILGTQEKNRDFDLIVPKLGIDVPVIENVDGGNKNEYMEGLKKGIAHFKGTSLPGEGSNIFLFGHSSSDELGKYNKVFSNIDDLQINDSIKLFYKSIEYEYLVFDKIVVEADDTSVLEKTDEEQLTLMTCWPIRSNEKRIIVKSKLKSNN